MTTVHEAIRIEAPYVQAVVALEQRLGLSRARREGRSTLALIAPFEGREIVRDVTAVTTRIPGAANFSSAYGIAWMPGTTAGGIPTPGLKGTLTLRAGEDYDECELVLDGRYDVPGGLAGRFFDDVVGRRIAHATLGVLLDGVCRTLRTEYERVEAAKRVTRAADA